jgi:proton glutamate symport protein
VNHTFIKKAAKSPIAIFIGLLTGIYLGLYQKEVSYYIAPLGRIYLSCLQMTIIPLIFASVATSFTNLLASHETKAYLKKIFNVFLLLLLLASGLGMMAALILKPGLGLDKNPDLTKIMNKSGIVIAREVTENDPIELNNAKSLINFLTESVPSNLFSSFAEGKVLQLIVFTIIFGIAISYLQTQRREEMLRLLDGVHETFQLIIGGAIRLLPVGVCFLIAEQLSGITFEILVSMLKFVFMAIGAMTVFFFLCSLIIWHNSSLGYFESLAKMKNSIIVTLTTSNSLVALPSATETLVKDFKYDEKIIDLVLPLGIVICRYGNILYFAFATVFISQLYNIPLDMPAYIIILLGSILAGLTTSGSTGIITLSMMTIILEPLGLPFGAALVLFIAIDPIIDPFRSLLIVYANCTAACIIGNTYEKRKKQVPSKSA